MTEKKPRTLAQKIWHFPLVAFLRESLFLYFDCRGPQMAACFSYFVLLTVFPILICVSSILGQLNIDIVSLSTNLENILPAAALNVIRGYLSYVNMHQSPGFFFAGLVACWFSAAAAFRTITRVIIDAYEDVQQSMVRGVINSIIFPFALILTLGLSILVVVTGQRTIETLAARFPMLDVALRMWSWSRYFLLFVVFLLFILAVLTMAAPRGTPRFPILLSGLVSALALVVSSAVFSWFIELSSRYSLVYGSLMSLIVLLVWLYLCGQILFLGVVFTSVWYQNWRGARRFIRYFNRAQNGEPTEDLSETESETS